MIDLNIDPTAFKIFGFEIKWYGISYCVAFILGEHLAKFYSKFIKIEKEEISKIMFSFVLFIFIGARIAHFLFYEPKFFTKEIFYIRNGGMSFHGGFCGAILALFFNKKNHNINSLFDLSALSAPIGLFFGRIANFINKEILGINNHPVTLYEAFFEGLILFIILNYKAKEKLSNKPGYIAFQFLFYYSIFRFFLEFFKIPESLFLNKINMGQALTIPLFILSLIYFNLKLFRKN